MSNNGERVYINKPLQQDDIFPIVTVKPMQELIGIPARKGLSRAVISAGQLVNVVSDSYGFLPNDRFFKEVEEQIINADINYIQRTINRDNRSFAADYILADENYHIQVKNGTDKIRPMLRFTNSYDGSCRTAGYFGFYREICSNGLHVAKTDFGFSIKHKGDVATLVMPHIKGIVEKFIKNEYYQLQRKFEVMAETPINDLSDYVKLTAEHFKLFQYASSETNPEPSLNARIVEESIKREANLLGVKPNLWLGYNAFNGILHGKLKRTFENQRALDARIFEDAFEMADYKVGI